jgi:hypothetical protein
MTTHQRDSIALTKIEKYIDAQIDDVLLCPECKKEHGATKELSAAAVALIRARYDKLRPTLSAVEQTQHEEPKGEEQIIQELRGLFAAKPELLGLLGLEGKPRLVDVADPQQSQCNMGESA